MHEQIAQFVNQLIALRQDSMTDVIQWSVAKFHSFALPAIENLLLETITAGTPVMIIVTRPLGLDPKFSSVRECHKNVTTLQTAGAGQTTGRHLGTPHYYRNHPS